MRTHSVLWVVRDFKGQKESRVINNNKITPFTHAEISVSCWEAEKDFISRLMKSVSAVGIFVSLDPPLTVSLSHTHKCSFLKAV